MAFLVRRARAYLRELDGWERALLGIALLGHLLALTWGLPASEGWDNDGIAPRDFLPGLIETFTPHHYFTYPPFHLALLALLTLPVTLVTLARAPSFAASDLVTTFIQVPTMTSFALVARVLSLTMSMGIVLLVGELANDVAKQHARNGGRTLVHARAFAFAAAGLEYSGTYYGHTSNLDVPYLFWGVLAIFVVSRAARRDDPRALAKAAIFAGFSITTKDQAYGLFALSFPLVVVAWALAKKKSGEPLGDLARASARAAVVAVLTVLLIDGALFNPYGFAERVHFLSGPASQDFAQYAPTFSGRLFVLADIARAFAKSYSLLLAVPFAAGLACAWGKKADSKERLASTVPLVAALSFTIAFNCVARRAEERFTLPQMQLAAVYIGVGLAWIAARWLASPRLAFAGVVTLLIVAFASETWLDARLLATMFGDPRYDAEQYLRDHARPGDTIETYGRNVYLPRFPPGPRVVRVGPAPADHVAPMPHVEELVAPFDQAAARDPRFIVVSQCDVWKYLRAPTASEPGHVVPLGEAATLRDTIATSYFRDLFADRTPYSVVHESIARTWIFEPLEMHASLSCKVWTFTRRPATSGE